MSYDLLIERVDGEPFDRAAVDAAVAQFPQLRRYDAESFRSASTELILAADHVGGPVDNMTLHLRYSEFPASFDAACDTALGLAAALGGRVVDSQLGDTVTAENRGASRKKAEQVALWSKRLGSEFEAPPKRYVDTPTERAPAQSNSGRPLVEVLGARLTPALD